MTSDRLPATVTWMFTPLSREIENLCINISIHFDLSLLFEKAYVPGVLNWESPWDKPSYVEANGKWVLVYFYPKSLTENYVAIHDSKNRTFYAMRFAELPTIGSVGVLGKGSKII